ncbi:MAG: hypothetical protein A4E62_02151 [Syntrophorhabdus sp. PtaU1.Bin002]|nr:MAG: hypothetical protein A4E62_02151 [Syntrophorhabdus sp. PtaU1.Bin002]
MLLILYLGNASDGGGNWFLTFFLSASPTAWSNQIKVHEYTSAHWGYEITISSNQVSMASGGRSTNLPATDPSTLEVPDIQPLGVK